MKSVLSRDYDQSYADKVYLLKRQEVKTLAFFFCSIPPTDNICPGRNSLLDKHNRWGQVLVTSEKGGLKSG